MYDTHNAFKRNKKEIDGLEVLVIGNSTLILSKFIMTFLYNIKMKKKNCLTVVSFHAYIHTSKNNCGINIRNALMDHLNKSELGPGILSIGNSGVTDAGDDS